MILKKSKTFVTSEGQLLVSIEEKIFDFNNIVDPAKYHQKKYLPKPIVIGSNPKLKRRIILLFKDLVYENNRKCPGIGATRLYRNFKKVFGIKSNKWNTIFEYPVGCGSEIVYYLENKYNNIIIGKNFNKTPRKAFLQPRNFMYKREADLLAEIGLSTKSSEVKKILSEFFEVAKQYGIKFESALAICSVPGNSC